jgi:hypothetical protein
VDLARIPGVEALAGLVRQRPNIPEEWLVELQARYRVQLKQLRAFGFTDAAQNVEALVEADGNVGLALAALDG